MGGRGGRLGGEGGVVGRGGGGRGGGAGGKERGEDLVDVGNLGVRGPGGVLGSAGQGQGVEVELVGVALVGHLCQDVLVIVVPAIRI